jgi:hypothetical protein
MDERLAAAKKKGFGPASPGWEAFDVGQVAARAADRLGDSKDWESARLLLYRSATVLLADAHLARSGHARLDATGNADDQKRSAESTEPSRPDGEPPLDRPGATPAAAALGGRGNHFELGCEAVRAAERLRESGGPESGALLLHRTAAVLFVHAHLAEAGGELRPHALSAQDWDRLVELSTGAREIAQLPQEHRNLVIECLGPEGESRMATMSPEERRVAKRQLARLARALAAPLRAQAKIVQRVVFNRWLRIGLSVTLPLAGIAYAVLSGGWFEAKNLALHQPVTVSSKFAVDIGRDPSKLVDGDTTNLGFHTADGPQQHVTVDLGEVRSVHEVVVYNRTDCCQDRAVPLLVEVSKDARAYQQVAKRNETFDVWHATFPSVDARYVRLTRPKKEYFHLAEVEVY